MDDAFDVMARQQRMREQLYRNHKETYSLYGRMGLDYDYTLIKTGIKFEDIGDQTRHYLYTWRHVEARREL